MSEPPQTTDATLEPHCRCASMTGLVAALGVALLLRLYLCYTAIAIAPDGGLFIHYARDLRAEPIAALRDYSHRQAPLYAVLVAAAVTPAQWVASGADAWILAGRAVATAFGLLAIVGVFLLSRRLFNGRVAVIAAFLMAILPDAAQLCANVLSDMTHLSLYLLALVALIVAIERGVSATFALIAGGLSGLAFLTRPEGATVAVIGIALLLVIGRGRMSRRFVAALCVIAGFILIAGPYQALTGKLVAKKDLFEMLRLALGLMPSQSRGIAFAADMVAPVEVLRQWFRAGRVVIPLLAIAAFRLWPPRAPGRWVVLSAFGAHMALLNLLDLRHGYVDRRHALLLAVLCLPMAAATLQALGERAARRWGACWSSGVVIGSIIAFLIGMGPWLLRPVEAGDDHIPAMGRWLAEHTPADAPIVATSRLRRVAVYAERDFREWDWWQWQPRHLARSLGEVNQPCVVLLDVDEISRTDRNPAFFEQLEAKPAAPASESAQAGPGEWTFAGGRLSLLHESPGSGAISKRRLRAYEWSPGK
ncbi:MAG: glycosyltransferase family 39 protein [Phycisphaerales bacterium]|nr:glycosyltransferase family 39 protein [Phycisphaerales bacterium]